MKKSIAIIDCALEEPAYACFNRLTRECEEHLSYHHFPSQLDKSLLLEEKIDALIVLGSHSNVGDGSPWHPPLVDYCYQMLKNDKPVLGICFAHQLMADFFGSKISKNTDSKIMKGLRRVQFRRGILNINEKSLSFFTSHLYQVSSLSKELEIVGSTEDSPYEMLAHKTLPYWSVQSHPEGSMFFINNELEDTVSQNEISIGMHDGLYFIKKFISYV